MGHLDRGAESLGARILGVVSKSGSIVPGPINVGLELLVEKKKEKRKAPNRSELANGLCSLSTRVYVELAEVFINSTAFHCFTIGKSTSLKVVSTTANKAGGSTPKSVSVAKKRGKKRLENASAVDLRQPKDRDPSVNNESEIQELIASLPPLIDFGLSTHHLIAIGYNYNSTKILFGNSIFNQWMENHNDRWTQALPRFDSQFKDLYANYSVEVRVNMLFAQYANDWRRVLKFLISLFDDDALGKVEKNTEYTWGVRAIALQVAQQIPFSFFDVGLVNDSKVPQEDLYFLRDDRSNPALRNETPLVQFWLMCASIFDHPWTMLFDEFLEESPISCIQEIKLKVIEGFPNDETSKVDIHKGVKKIFDRDYEDSEEEDDPMGDEDTGLVNKIGQPDG
ncbi:unnamed protein product [Cylindrotheca closterium]|uniref:Uncharacterized protein n=1 Tax=Cylindrotheca closterium TaxID=2856 RepID=A0AAD2JHI5_9STRA|nr:unnamed protein product [Cylindrotheca closterium]